MSRFRLEKVDNFCLIENYLKLDIYCDQLGLVLFRLP